MTTTINANTSAGLVYTADTSGVLKVQSNGVTTNALAWVNFNGGNGNTAGAINASYNVSSITVNSTGDYTANFTTPMANTYYCFAGSAYYAADAASSNSALLGAGRQAFPTTTACRFTTQITNTAYNCTYVNIAFFGQ